MEIIKLYSIFDEKADKFGPIFESINDEVATRAFYQLLEKIPEISKNDYVLYYIGEFNTLSGELNYNLPEEVFRNIKIVEVKKA